jgi:hypothetical protein
MKVPLRLALAALIGWVFAANATAQEITFKDPVGDAKDGGSFDITDVHINVNRGEVEFDVTVNASVDDLWRTDTSFSTQTIFVFIDTDHKDGVGFTAGFPGLNVTFASADAWDHVVILSSRSSSRIRAEVQSKAPAMQAAVVVPYRTKYAGHTISGSVPLADFLSFSSNVDASNPTKWGFQVVMQSNDLPDGACAPPVMDILAGKGTGDASEAETQFKSLVFECNADGTAKKLATLPMVRK